MNSVTSPWPSFLWARRGVPSALRCGLAALALLPLAAAAGPNDPITLRMKFKAGDVNDYQTGLQFVISMPGMTQPGNKAGNGKGQPGGMTQQMNLLQHIKVTKVLPNGNAEVETTVTNPQGGAGGSKPTTVVYDPMGHVVSTKTNGGAGNAAQSMNPIGMLSSNATGFQGTFLPAKPVKPGDIWTQNVPIPGNANGATVKAKFIKMTTVGRFKTAHLQINLAVPISVMTDAANQPTNDAQKATGTVTGTVNMTFENDFAVAEGKLIRSAGTGTMDMTMARKAGNAPKNGASGQPQKTAINAKITTTTTLVQK